MTEKSGKVGFLFHLGHGHYTQFLNFQECLPTQLDGRPEWIPLPGDHSGDRVANLRFLPAGIRYRRHQIWHACQGVARQGEWDALFFACMQIGLLPVLRRHRSYLYTDLSPSLKKELAPWYNHQLPRNRVQAWLKNCVEVRVYAALAGLFTMSRWSAEGIRRDYKVPSERIHVSLPGANLKRWQLVDRSDRSARRPVRILMVGGQFRLKGGDLVLDWAERSRVRDWEMDIVTWPGELPGWVQDCLGRPAADARVTQRLAPRLPNVRIHCGIRANTPEAMQLFADADIFCLPTQADGSSIASLEAMATGLPVLVGAVGGIPELIKDGETGFFMQPGDGADLECKLERLIADREMRLAVGGAARQSCEDQFNVVRQLNEIFQILDRDRGAPRR